jgi:hypothetical protein
MEMHRLANRQTSVRESLVGSSGRCRHYHHLTVGHSLPEVDSGSFLDLSEGRWPSLPVSELVP